MSGRRLSGFLLAGLLHWFALLPSSLPAQTIDARFQTVQVSTAWRAAEIEGRQLWVSEQTISLRVDIRTRAQVGWQKVVAKGKVRTNRFSTSARWFEVERLVREEGSRQIALSFRRTEGAEGTADVAEGLFTYVAPRIDTTALLLLERGRRGERGYRLSYSRVHAGTEAADTTGIALLMRSVQRSGWQVHLEGGIYADRHGDTSYRAVVSGWVGKGLGKDARLQLGATFAPRGFSFAGTSLEALTAFALYQPGSLVQSWRDRPAGYFTLQLTAER